ncbi:MAG: LacI family DNA-binding transcriptional regulator [Phycisphaeraceae bacterium]
MPQRAAKLRTPHRATLRDVARVANVSVPVAGVVLNGGPGNNSRASAETAKRIRAAALRLQYRPNPAARQLRGKRTQTFGLLVTSAGDPQRGLLVQQLDIEAVKIGCHTLIGNTIGGLAHEPDQFDYYTEELSHRHVDGVLCVVHRWSPGNRRELLARHPNTVFYEDPGVPGASYVAPDRRYGARLSVEHLAKRGRRRIGLAMLDLTWDFYHERVAGHVEALEELNLPADLVHLGDWRTLCPNLGSSGVVASFDYLDVLAEQAVADLVHRRHADAIVAHDDYWAATLVRCLLRQGLSVPRDVAVMGYADYMFAPWTERPLSTIRPNYFEAASVMVRMVERMITQGPLPPDDRTVRITPELVVRQST